MTFLKKALSHWQWVSAFAVSFLLFAYSPYLFQFFDTESGFTPYDLGYAQRAVLALVWFSFAIGCMWLALAIITPSLDKWLDEGKFQKVWGMMYIIAVEHDQRLTPTWVRVMAGAVLLSFLFGVLALLLFAYLICLIQVPI